MRDKTGKEELIINIVDKKLRKKMFDEEPLVVCYDEAKTEILKLQKFIKRLFRTFRFREHEIYLSVENFNKFKQKIKDLK